MSELFDPTADIEVLDGLERVDVRDTSEAVSCTNVSAWRSKLSFRELQFDGGLGLSPTDIAFRLLANDNLKFTPDKRDIIRDAAGDVWTVLSVTAWGPGRTVGAWRCVCRKQPK